MPVCFHDFISSGRDFYTAVSSFCKDHQKKVSPLDKEKKRKEKSISSDIVDIVDIVDHKPSLYLSSARMVDEKNCKIIIKEILHL